MTRYISKINNNFNKKNNDIIYISADFETLLIDNEHYVFAIGYYYNNEFYNKNNFEYIYIKDNLKNNDEIKRESENIIIEFINKLKLLSKKNKKYIYFHNLGTFDGIFILKYINKMNIQDNLFEAIIRNNRIYKIKIENLIFLDTMLILNDNLENLAIKLLNDKKINIDYTSFNSYKKCIINKNNVINYLYKDTIILFNIIQNMYNIFINIFNVNITNNFTISSIAFHIYRKSYMNYNIYIPTYYEYLFLRRSYKGGLNNILIPKINNGYIYDVNSLYPFIMKNYEMPIDKPIWIHDNFESIENYFGFIECTILIPDDCIFPPLTIKRNNTLIQPLGIIKDTFFIEEVKNSLQYNCKIIKIHKICHFKDKYIIFDKYIDEMYTKRLENINNNTNNLMYKLLMNSLYGRFGIRNTITKTNIKDKSKEWLYNVLYSIENPFIDNNLITYSYNQEYILYLKENINNMNYTKDNKEIILNEINKILIEFDKTNNAIQISSAISAYARIYIINIIYNHIKEGGNIYYYDTDSIHTDKPLNNNLISQNELGKFKLEKIIKEGYYLSPKIYAILDNNNNTTIKFKGLNLENIKDINFNWFKEKYNSKEPFKTIILRNIKKCLHDLKIIKTNTIYNTNFESLKYEKIWKNSQWIKNTWTKWKEN